MFERENPALLNSVAKKSKSKYDFTLYYIIASVEIFGYR